MTNCRKGDLAIVVAPALRENLGVFVEVLRRSGTEPLTWWVQPLTARRTRWDPAIRAGANVPDSGLRPIRGFRKVRPRDRSYGRNAAAMRPFHVHPGYE